MAQDATSLPGVLILSPLRSPSKISGPAAKPEPRGRIALLTEPAHRLMMDGEGL